MGSIERETIREQKAFENAYPKAELDEYMQDGETLVDPFEALYHFGFPTVKPEARDLVLAEISASRFGPQIIAEDTPKGIRIHKRDVIPLLKGGQDIAIRVFDLFEDDFKNAFSDTYSIHALDLLKKEQEERANKKKEADWQK